MQFRIVDHLKDGSLGSKESWVRLFLSGSAIINIDSQRVEIEPCTLLFVQNYKVIEVSEDLSILEINDTLENTDIQLQTAVLNPEPFQVLYESFIEGFGDANHKKLSYNYVISHCKQKEQSIQTQRAHDDKETIYSYIESHLDDDLSLDFLSKRYGCSVQTLRRQFKKEKSCSPTEYIQQVKMTEAKSLLEQTDMNILAIAYKLGFSDTASFSHAFKKYTQSSPNEYRKSNKWLM